MLARLPVQPWMTTEETVRLMDALEMGGINARFVGGCVRDAYLNRPVFDIDIAVDAPPQTVQEALDARKIAWRPTGIDHGTLTAIVNRKPFQITSLRKDVETFGRHATVAFTKDWVEDAQRRDFTMNALYADRNGYLFDPCGEGFTDLDQGLVRFIGNPLHRIAEDALRILRFFRFTAHYAKRETDPLGLKACTASIDKLLSLSKERIAYEVLRLCSAYDVAPVLTQMEQIGILKALFPFGKDFPSGLTRLKNLHILEKNLNLETSPLNRLAALFERGGGDTLSENLKFSKQDSQYFSLLLNQIQIHKETPPSLFQIKKWLYLHGPSLTQDSLLLIAAGRLMQGQETRQELVHLLQPLIQKTTAWQHPIFPLKGADLVAEGMTPGPQISFYLDKVQDWWIQRDFTPTKDQCLNYFREQAR